MPDLPPLKPTEGRAPRAGAPPLPPLGDPVQPQSGGAEEPPRRIPQGAAGELRRVTSRHRRGGSGTGRGGSDSGRGEEAEDIPLRKGSIDSAGSRERSRDGAAPEAGGPRRVRKASEAGSSVSGRSDRSGGSGQQAPVPARRPPQQPPLPAPQPTTSPGRYYAGEATRRLEAAGRSTEEHGLATSTYTFQEDTGLLTTAAGAGDGLGDRRHTMYVEQPNNRFIQVKGTERGRFSLNPIAAFRRRALGRAQRRPDGNSWTTAEYDDDDGNITILKKAADAFQSLASYISLFSQGLLGGLGLTNLIMTFLVNPTDTTAFLRYYSPIAMNLNRFYYVLVTFALVATINKYFRNTVLKWGQFGRRQRTCDAFLILLYGAAYIVCIIITPYDDLLTYNSMRVPDYYDMKLGDVFRSRLTVWQILSIIRMSLVLVAWFIASAEFAPMTLMTYWRFSNPHRLVMPPMTRIHSTGGVVLASDGSAMPAAGPGSIIGGSTLGAVAMGSTLGGPPMGPTQPPSFSGSPSGSMTRTGAADAARQLQAAKVSGATPPKQGATTTTFRP